MILWFDISGCSPDETLDDTSNVCDVCDVCDADADADADAGEISSCIRTIQSPGVGYSADNEMVALRGP